MLFIKNLYLLFSMLTVLSIPFGIFKIYLINNLTLNDLLIIASIVTGAIALLVQLNAGYFRIYFNGIVLVFYISLQLLYSVYTGAHLAFYGYAIFYAIMYTLFSLENYQRMMTLLGVVTILSAVLMILNYGDLSRAGYFINGERVDPNIIGIGLVIGLAVIIFGRNGKIYKSISVLIISYAIYATMSRSSILSLILIVFYYLKVNKYYFYAVVLMLSIASIVMYSFIYTPDPDGIMERFINNPHWNTRILIVTNLWNEFYTSLSNILFGWSIGFKNPHTLYLFIFFSSGLFGIFFLAYFVYKMLRMNNAHKKTCEMLTSNAILLAVIFWSSVYLSLKVVLFSIFVYLFTRKRLALEYRK